jgi:hypothetical protein
MTAQKKIRVNVSSQHIQDTVAIIKKNSVDHQDGDIFSFRGYAFHFDQKNLYIVKPNTKRVLACEECFNLENRVGTHAVMPFRLCRTHAEKAGFVRSRSCRCTSIHNIYCMNHAKQYDYHENCSYSNCAATQDTRKYDKIHSKYCFVHARTEKTDWYLAYRRAKTCNFPHCTRQKEPTAYDDKPYPYCLQHALC